MSWTIKRLDSRHVGREFGCGVVELDEYLRRFAGQDARRGFSVTYALTKKGEFNVMGYYTLSGGQVSTQLIDAAERRRLPRYPAPVIRLGRLALDKSLQGVGMGRHLLMDAMARTLRVARAVGVYALAVDAKDTQAREFYLRHGFRDLSDSELHLYLPVETIRALVEG